MIFHGQRKSYKFSSILIWHDSHIMNVFHLMMKYSVKEFLLSFEENLVMIRYVIPFKSLLTHSVLLLLLLFLIIDSHVCEYYQLFQHILVMVRWLHLHFFLTFIVHEYNFYGKKSAEWSKYGVNFFFVSRKIVYQK